MAKNNDGRQANQFGTFGGVFTPNILTILGIILFLRFGWVVGNAGLWQALLMVFLGSAITFLTGLSLSSVATNIQVKAGGAYYLVSRSLGIEVGGSIGIPLYLSQAISVAFYLIGFAEAFSFIFPGVPPVLTAGLGCLVFGIVAFIGADFAVKLQYAILAVLGLSLVSFFFGGSPMSIPIQTAAHYTPGHHFWSVFAIFFPAVTGIMSGLSMSGDLRDPHKSIPRGTLWAVACSYVIYSAAVYWFASSAMVGELQNDRFIMQKISRWPVFFVAGVWAATLSSALASMVAAPRTLQALAHDKVLPGLLSNKLGSKSEPRLAVIITFGLAEVIILFSNLDLVAPVITMFFLNTYGMLNLAAGLERLTGNPSYRPTLRVPGILSILGALGCYGAMFLIHTPATVAAILISYSIYFILEKRFLRQTWGDARTGIWYALARFALLRLEEMPLHPKNWKPNIMVFSGNPFRRPHLTNLADWLEKGNGITSFFHLVVGNPDDPLVQQAGRTAKNHLKKFIREKGMAAFAESQVVADFEGGVSTVVQSHGLGALKPNIALFGMAKAREEQERVARIIRNLAVLETSVLVLELDEEKGFGQRSTIDVWWGGLGGSGDFMLLIAHLISLHEDWQAVRVRVIRVIDHPEGIAAAENNIQELFDQMRFSAEALVIARRYPEQPISELVAEHSGMTDLTIMGIGPIEKGGETEFAEKTLSFIEPLNAVLLAKSSGVGHLLER
jgi:amino acid transporter